jgi:hypothetical protein
MAVAGKLSSDREILAGLIGIARTTSATQASPVTTRRYAR